MYIYFIHKCGESFITFHFLCGYGYALEVNPLADPSQQCPQNNNVDLYPSASAWHHSTIIFIMF